MLTLVRQRSGYREKTMEIIQGPSSRLPWAWNNLCFGTAMHERSPVGLHDVVNNVTHSSSNSITWISDDRGNPTVHCFGYVMYPNYPAHNRPDTELTAYVRARWKVAKTSCGVFCYPYTTGVSPFMTWGILTSSDGLMKASVMLTVGGTIYQLADTAAITNNRYVSVFLRWRSGEAPQVDVYDERGNIISTVVHGVTATGSLTYAASTGVRINCTDDSAAQCDNNYSQAMIWSRRLTDSETVALVGDPFGWYAPRRETVVVAAPFPVGPGALDTGFRFIGPGG